MRHIYAYRVTYLIAAIIVLVAMLFAWLRSQDVPPPRETAAGHVHRTAVAPATANAGPVRGTGGARGVGRARPTR